MTINFPYRFASLPRPRLTPDDIRIIENFEKAVKIRQQNGRLVYYINDENKEKMRKAANVLNDPYLSPLEASNLKYYLRIANQTHASNKIRTAWKASRARAQGNIMFVAPNGTKYFNPARFRRYIRNQAASKRKFNARTRTQSPLPNIPRAWGKWFGPYNHKEYISENGRWKYYKNSNRLVNTANNKTYTNARKRFGIPF